MPAWALAAGKALLAPLASRTIPALRRLHAARRAAGGGPSLCDDRVGLLLADAMNAITGSRAPPSWWTPALEKMRAAFVSPLPLSRGGSLHACLEDPAAKSALRTMLTRRLAGFPADGEEDRDDRATLASRYQALVGDAGRLADMHADAVLAVAMARLAADLGADAPSRALAAQQQAGNERIVASLEGNMALLRDDLAAMQSQLRDGSLAGGLPGLL